MLGLSGRAEDGFSVQVRRPGENVLSFPPEFGEEAGYVYINSESTQVPLGWHSDSKQTHQVFLLCIQN